MIGQMGSTDGAPVPVMTGPSISSKELNRLKELTDKIPGLEEMLNKIMKDLKELNLGEIRERLTNLEKALVGKADKSEI
jgi:hypothetical protein